LEPATNTLALVVALPATSRGSPLDRRFPSGSCGIRFEHSTFVCVLTQARISTAASYLAMRRKGGKPVIASKKF